jgi:hypothetical protein
VRNHGSSGNIHIHMCISRVMVVIILILLQGVFVSCLVSGAVMGRLVGHLLQQHFAEVSDSGTYALVGAAAMIGTENWLFTELSLFDILVIVCFQVVCVATRYR